MQAATPLHEHSAPVAGTEIHWVEIGQGEPVMLIHGSLCDYRYWRWQMSALSQGFRVVAPSLPGCWPDAVGASSASQNLTGQREDALADTRYSIARHVQAVVELCIQICGKQGVHLIGHSRGAQVAVEAALAMSGRVRSLVLADPGFQFTGEPQTRAVHNMVAQKLGLAPLDDVISEFVDSVNGSDTWRKTVPWFKDMVRSNAWTLLPQTKDMERCVDADQLGRAVDCPVLLVGGEHSPSRYGSRIQRLLEVWPHAHHEVVPRAAHGMNLANARHFNDVVLRFLRDAQETSW